MKTVKSGQHQKIMRFNLVYLKTQIKRLSVTDKEKSLFWFSAYKKHGGKLSYKEIIEG